MRIPGAISKEIFIRIASELAVGVDAVFEAVTVVIACCALVDINALAVLASVAIFASWDTVANEWSTACGFPWCGGGGVWSISCARVFSGAGILSCAGILAVVAIAADAVEATGGVVLASMRVAAVVVGAGHELASGAVFKGAVLVGAIVAVVEAVAELVLEDRSDDIHVISVDAL